jgi:hypothetical protein
MNQLLKTIAKYLGILSGDNGCAYYDSTHSSVERGVKAFVVNTSCTFSALEQRGTNVLTSMNLSGTVLKPGTFISAPNDKPFTKFTIASGSVIAYFV